MTREEIDERKQILLDTVSVPDILYRYGVSVRNGRCKAICHEGNNYTVKVSHGLYYCFKCNRSMDIFDITMHFNNCDFWTAFELLGGTEKQSFRSSRVAKEAIRERKTRIAQRKVEELTLRGIQMHITAYRNIIASNEPYSDLWCYAQDKLPYQLYLLEEYNERGCLPCKK